MSIKESDFDFESMKDRVLEQLRSGESLYGKNGAFAPLMKQFLEAALEAEMESHMDEAERSGGNRRNGKSSRQIRRLDAYVICKSGKLGVLLKDYEAIGVKVLPFRIGYVDIRAFRRLYIFLKVNRFNSACDFTGNFAALPLLVAACADVSKRITFYRNAENRFKGGVFRAIFNNMLNFIVKLSASKIADIYGWTWKHLIVDEKQLQENCQIVIENGCEYTPIHLHAMPQVARESHLDCVLAGSFGDSVGRAEFSGRKVTELVGLENRIKNIGGILRHDFRKIVMKDVLADINRYHALFPKEKSTSNMNRINNFTI